MKHNAPFSFSKFGPKTNFEKKILTAKFQSQIKSGMVIAYQCPASHDILTLFCFGFCFHFTSNTSSVLR